MKLYIYCSSFYSVLYKFTLWIHDTNMFASFSENLNFTV